jgi:protein-tyrosine phosphatase
MGYVDLHCHILPKVDDGPKTMGESIEMLRIAKAEGFTDIVATPHYAPLIPGFQGVYDATRSASLFSLLASSAKELGITLHEGSEIRLDEYAHANFEAGRCLPLGHGRHVLLELPDNAVLDHQYGWMTAFVLAGWIPILAHVERLQALQADPYALEEWVEAGCLLQVNASSLTVSNESSRQHSDASSLQILNVAIRQMSNSSRQDGRDESSLWSHFTNWTDPRRKTAKNLLKKDLCHLVATDAHSPFSRTPLAREAFKNVSRWVGEETANELFCYTPRRILGLPELPETAYHRE